MSTEQELITAWVSTHHSLLITHYFSLPSAHRRQNRYLAVFRKRRVEQFFTSYVVIVEKNVYVLPELPLFMFTLDRAGQYAGATKCQELPTVAAGESRRSGSVRS